MRLAESILASIEERRGDVERQPPRGTHLGPRTVLFLTGEPSGDAAGARLAAELRSLDPDVRLRAVGGRRLAGAGCEILEDTARLSAMGFVEVLRLVPRLQRLEVALAAPARRGAPRRRCADRLSGFQSAHRTLRAGARGITGRVLHRTPGVGVGREPASAIRRAVGRMLVVFPFETEIYRRAGIPVEFVGHPLLDATRDAPSRGAARAALGVSSSSPRAGSRGRESLAGGAPYLSGHGRVGRSECDVACPTSP